MSGSEREPSGICRARALAWSRASSPSEPQKPLPFDPEWDACEAEFTRRDLAALERLADLDSADPVSAEDADAVVSVVGELLGLGDELDLFDDQDDVTAGKLRSGVGRMLEKVMRYERHLEQAIHKNLHELQRLQALRQGQPVAAPIAVDVAVSCGDPCGEVER